MHGISGKKEFTINKQGARGSLFTDSTYNIICIGGSTTECLYLDDSESWPAILESRLRDGWKKNVNVASIGKSGCTSGINFLHLKYSVPFIKNTNAAILMCGLNDCMQWLSYPNDSLLEFVDEQKKVSQVFFADKIVGYSIRKSAIYKLLKNACKGCDATVKWKIQDSKAASYSDWRQNRHNATILIDTIPHLEMALTAYANNLEKMYIEAQKQKIRMIVCNQAFLYDSLLNPQLDSLLWMGGVGDYQKPGKHAYYSRKALQVCLGQFNKATHIFCSRHSDVVEVQLEGKLPKDTTVFYDDCHFNQNGAKRVAELIAASFYTIKH